MVGAYRSDVALTFLAALALVVGAGCGETGQPEKAEPPPVAARPPPGPILPVPSSGSDGVLVKVEGGKWCEIPAGQVFLNGNARLCSSLVMETLYAEEVVGVAHRRVIMKSTYHQPGPTTDAGDMVSWNEADVRYNCRTHEFWVLSVVTYGATGSVIQTETPDPPRQAPAGNPDLGQIVCSVPL